MGSKLTTIFLGLAMAFALPLQGACGESGEDSRHERAALSPVPGAAWAGIAKDLGADAGHLAWELAARLRLRYAHWTAGRLDEIASADRALISRLSKEDRLTGHLRLQTHPAWEYPHLGLAVWRLEIHAQGDVRATYFVLMSEGTIRAPDVWRRLMARLPGHEAFQRTMQRLRQEGFVELAPLELRAYFPLAFTSPQQFVSEEMVLEGWLHDIRSRLQSPPALAGYAVVRFCYRAMLSLWRVPSLHKMPVLTEIAALSFFAKHRDMWLWHRRESLREAPVHVRQQGLFYEQKVLGVRGAHRNAARFILGARAMGPVGFIPGQEKLRDLRTYVLSIEDMQAGELALLQTGDSLAATLGAMHLASALLARGKDIWSVNGSVGRWVDRSRGLRPPKPALAQKPWQASPVSLEALPHGPTDYEGAVRSDGALRLAQVLPLRPTLRDVKSRFSFWIRNARVLPPAKRRIPLWNSPVQKEVWQRVFDEYVRASHRNAVVADIRNRLRAERDTALRLYAAWDPSWWLSLSRLSAFEQEERIEAHLRGLQAALQDVEAALREVHKISPAAWLELHEVYGHGDLLGRRGIEAMHALLVERGHVRDTGLTLSREDQILWGLRTLAGVDPAAFIYGVPRQLTQPIAGVPTDRQRIFKDLVHKRLTRMSRRQLNDYFEKLSVSDQQEREQNLMHTWKVIMKKRAAGALLFRALISRLEDALDAREDMVPLLESVRVILGHHYHVVQGPVRRYVQDPGSNLIVRCMVISMLADTGHPSFARELHAMFRQPRFFGGVPPELLIRGILRTGQEGVIRACLGSILHHAQESYLAHFVESWSHPSAAHNSPTLLKSLFSLVEMHREESLTERMRLGLGLLCVELGTRARWSMAKKIRATAVELLDPIRRSSDADLRREATDALRRASRTDDALAPTH